jgi:hypothetical protein
VIWWSAFAFSADACWTLKFRILGLQCQKSWVVPGCFDQDKNDPEDKSSDFEIAWLVPFPPVLFTGNCWKELSNVGKLKDSYNSYPPKTESSRWCLLFLGGVGVVWLQLPPVPKIIRLQDHQHKKGRQVPWLERDLKVCWKSSQQSKSHKNEAQIKNCSICSDKTTCSKVCCMQFLWNITYQILDVGYGHGETERKRASLLETKTIRVRSIFTLRFFVSLGLLLAFATEEELADFGFSRNRRRLVSLQLVSPLFVVVVIIILFSEKNCKTFCIWRTLQSPPRDSGWSAVIVCNRSSEEWKRACAWFPHVVLGSFWKGKAFMLPCHDAIAGGIGGGIFGGFCYSLWRQQHWSESSLAEERLWKCEVCRLLHYHLWFW